MSSVDQNANEVVIVALVQTQILQPGVSDRSFDDQALQCRLD